MLRLTDTPDFKTLPFTLCLLNECSVNPLLPHCSFSLRKDSSAAMVSVRPCRSLCKLEEKHTLLQVDRPCQASRLGEWSAGWTSAPGLGTPCSKPPAGPGCRLLMRAAASSPLQPANSHSDQEGLTWESWHQRLLCLFPSPLPLKTKPKQQKCTPPIAPRYSDPEVHTAGRALGSLP